MFKNEFIPKCWVASDAVSWLPPFSNSELNEPVISTFPLVVLPNADKNIYILMTFLAISNVMSKEGDEIGVLTSRFQGSRFNKLFRIWFDSTWYFSLGWIIGLVIIWKIKVLYFKSCLLIWLRIYLVLFYSRIFQKFACN